MSDIETFRAKIEGYLESREMSPTQFGKRFAGDPLFVFQLRAGREPRYSTRQKILTAIDETQEAAE
ncbi:hypothetical protein [Rhizobium wuzhouense]|uniref:XRE family transcriptional regulator n=1 Tax=Rhizobium wuzhouense TaxID=1986026 RepID=A0ABX5NSG9_9HYPH|nr:hypothetical protein [Rhizobium wuzhouense]PYB71504.1 hypothetical protein DMY87_18205 [Rhizobium wuzhouense]